MVLEATVNKVQARSARHMTGQWIGDKVLRQEILLYSESRQTEKMVDESLKITILSGFGCQFLL